MFKLIEVWMCFIQPWKMNDAFGSSSLPYDVDPSACALWTDFIRDNFFTYTDIFLIIAKRYCTMDLTLVSNIQFVLRVCNTFNQPAIIQTLKEFETEIVNLKSVKSAHHSTSPRVVTFAASPTHHQIQQQQRNIILAIFKDFDKHLATYRPLNSMQNLKIIARLIETLSNKIEMFESEMRFLLSRENRGFFARLFKSIFSTASEENLNNSVAFDSEDANGRIRCLQRCIVVVKDIYAVNSTFLR